MGTIYRKTAQGLDEIETRARRLSPRLRAALILVDGKRSDHELRKFIPQQPDETLLALLEQGLIEAASVSGGGFASSQPQPLPAMPPAQANVPLQPVRSFEALRREAVHELNETLGPAGETLALRMERAGSPSQLQPLLESAVTVIGNARGGAAAAKFALKFLEQAA